jgi:SWI/SNF-related matrix-associated actin-dependent regulator of chromatin subfamily A member 5
MINEDIEAIINRGEQRTAEMTSKYEDLSFDDLNNFKLDTTVQQWEGEDFRSGVSIFVMRSSELLNCPSGKRQASSWSHPSGNVKAIIPSITTTRRLERTTSQIKAQNFLELLSQSSCASFFAIHPAI